MTGCVAQPDREQKGLLAGTQRVLALNFGRSVTGPRVQRLTRLPTAFAGEMRRVQTSFGIGSGSLLTTATTSELRRTQRIHKLGLQLLGSETKRRPHPFEGAWPSSYEFAENTANGIVTLGGLLGPTQRPLGEINDHTHRTDHADNRPVPTLWQRLRRRLPF
jgi:hypothetical protein